MITRSEREFIVNLTGGLGNQLFQIAHALINSNFSSLSLVQEFGRPRVNEIGEAEIFSFRLPFQHKKKGARDSNLFMRRILGHTLKVSEQPEKWETNNFYQFLCRALSNVVLSVHFRKLTLVSTCNSHYNLGRKAHSNVFFLGYFQRMLDKNVEQIRNTLSSLSLENISEKLQQEINYAQNKHISVLHLRLMDYFDEPKIGLLELDYFKKVVSTKNFNQELNEVWVFSDDHAKAEQTLKLPSHINVRFFSEKSLSVSETFELMRYGDQYILSNSTFGWWAAFLSKKKNVQVVAPSPWFKTLKFDPSLYLQGWQSENAQWRSDSSK